MQKVEGINPFDLCAILFSWMCVSINACFGILILSHLFINPILIIYILRNMESGFASALILGKCISHAALLST